MDIFSGWQGYLEKLEANWRSLVKDGDTVVIPGDISWGMSLAESKKDFEFINGLPGSKIILKGNHDYWWNTITKLTAFLNENGFSTISFVHNSAAVAGNIAVCGTRGPGS